jgi:uncharacterized protein YuzE
MDALASSRYPVPLGIDHLEHPIDAGSVETTAMFDPEHGMFALDLDAAGHILGLEVLGARAHLPAALLQEILNHTENNP